MASGDSLGQFEPQQMLPVLSGTAATLWTRNGHPIIQFDTTTGEVAIWRGRVPQNYSGNGFTAVITSAMASATSGTLGWLVAIERIGTVLDIDADSFDSDNTVTAATVPAAAGTPMEFTATVTNADSLVKGEMFRLRLTRNVAGDNGAGDGDFMGMELRET